MTGARGADSRDRARAARRARVLGVVGVGISVAGGAASLAVARATPAAKPAAPSSAAPPATEVRELRASPESAALSAEALRLDQEARAPATDVRIAPSLAKGALGAWLLAGPFRVGKPAMDTAPAGVDERALAPAANAEVGAARDYVEPASRGAGASARKKTTARWVVASSNEGPVDVKAALEANGADLVAYAAGVLHVDRAGRHLLLLGVDDGVRVIVDGKVVLTRDDARSVREDDDVVPLDLEAGDHVVVLKLHQRDGAWAFRARITDAELGVPRGAYLTLPGTTADDARALAAKMSWVSVDRGFAPELEPLRYRPKLTVRFPEGAPRGVMVPVSTRLVRSPEERAREPGEEAAFDLQAGGVPVTSAGAGELVVALPTLAPWSGAATLETTVAGRVVRSVFPARPLAEQAIARAERAIAKTSPTAPFLAPGSLDSVRYLSRRLSGLVARGDLDIEAQTDEAKELDRYAAALEKGVDPFEGRTGPTRRALRSPVDGELSEVGVYLPPWYKPGGSRKLPLVVGLHGLNGYSMGVMRWLFGGDDPKREQGWEDRHVGKLPDLDAVVLTPFAHGNSLYRELGETDVMNAVAWAMRAFPIDPTRVTITGMSMGGIGSAYIPLRRPHVFAAAEPLCGYHSYFVRSDVAGRALRPWERFLAEERSNAFWAENGAHLPLFIVHGTQDLPEENSGVLIERYEKLGFPVKHEHPESGHNVWQETYEDLKGLKWLLNRRADLHPAHVRFKTSRTRWNRSAWVTVDELASESGWAEIDARVRPKARTITGSTSGVAQVSFARDVAELERGAVTVVLDNQRLAFDEEEPLVASREGSSWKKGPAQHAGVWKHGTVTGPLRDVFHEPILFVWASDASEARATEQVARSFAKIRPGVQVSYPVTSDAELLARGEPLANDRALFLVGRTNKVTAALDRAAGGFPVRVDESGVTVGRDRFTGRELGAAFIRPNPLRPERYVVVVAGVDVPGTLRATSLPDLVPDFVVWDEALAPARGQVLLGAGALRAGGFFTKEWALPSSFADPLARTPRAAPPKEEAAAPFVP